MKKTPPNCVRSLKICSLDVIDDRGRHLTGRAKPPGWFMVWGEGLWLTALSLNPNLQPFMRRAKPTDLLIAASTGAIGRRCTRTEVSSVKGARRPPIISTAQPFGIVAQIGGLRAPQKRG